MSIHLHESERAIRAFEGIHRLQVTVHDFFGSLSPNLERERHFHSHPLCQCVKLAGGEPKCFEFEVVRLRADIHHCPNGRTHVCHAGLVEWVLPVYRGLELEWIIFAGVRLPGKDLLPTHRDTSTRWTRSPWKVGTVMPPEIAQSEAEMILEHLRQLAARLQSRTVEFTPPPKFRHLVGGDPAGQRHSEKQIQIRRYIEAHKTGPLRLKDLAAQLGVSEDRATHLIRECCGESFRDMLVQARLRMAKELLRFSSLSVLEVALSSGFNEISHFNRLFRKWVGMSPGQYRRSNLGPDGPRGNGTTRAVSQAAGGSSPAPIPNPASTVYWD